MDPISFFSPGFSATIKLYDISYQVRSTDEQTSDILNTASLVERNLREAQRLYLSKAESLSANEREWIEFALRDTRDALSGVTKLIEPARVYGSIGGQNGAVPKTYFTLKYTAEARDRHKMLNVCHQTLSAAVTRLLAKTLPVLGEGGVEKQKQEIPPPPYDQQMDKLWSWRDQRRNRRRMVNSRKVSEFDADPSKAALYRTAYSHSTTSLTKDPSLMKDSKLLSDIRRNNPPSYDIYNNPGNKLANGIYEMAGENSPPSSPGIPQLHGREIGPAPNKSPPMTPPFLVAGYPESMLSPPTTSSRRSSTVASTRHQRANSALSAQSNPFETASEGGNLTELDGVSISSRSRPSSVHTATTATIADAHSDHNSDYASSTRSPSISLSPNTTSSAETTARSSLALSMDRLWAQQQQSQSQSIPPTSSTIPPTTSEPPSLASTASVPSISTTTTSQLERAKEHFQLAKATLDSDMNRPTATSITSSSTNNTIPYPLHPASLRPGAGVLGTNRERAHSATAFSSTSKPLPPRPQSIMSPSSVDFTSSIKPNGAVELRAMNTLAERKRGNNNINVAGQPRSRGVRGSWLAYQASLREGPQARGQMPGHGQGQEKDAPQELDSSSVSEQKAEEAENAEENKEPMMSEEDRQRQLRWLHGQVQLGVQERVQGRIQGTHQRRGGGATSEQQQQHRKSMQQVQQHSVQRDERKLSDAAATPLPITPAEASPPALERNTTTAAEGAAVQAAPPITQEAAASMEDKQATSDQPQDISQILLPTRYQTPSPSTKPASETQPQVQEHPQPQKQESLPQQAQEKDQQQAQKQALFQELQHIQAQKPQIETQPPVIQSQTQPQIETQPPAQEQPSVQEQPQIEVQQPEPQLLLPTRYQSLGNRSRSASASRAASRSRSRGEIGGEIGGGGSVGRSRSQGGSRTASREGEGEGRDVEGQGQGEGASQRVGRAEVVGA